MKLRRIALAAVLLLALSGVFLVIRSALIVREDRTGPAAPSAVLLDPLPAGGQIVETKEVRLGSSEGLARSVLISATPQELPLARILLNMMGERGFKVQSPLAQSSDGKVCLIVLEPAAYVSSPYNRVAFENVGGPGESAIVTMFVC